MISNAVWFWSLLLLLIPSFFCLLFVLFNLLFDRTLRYALHNHAIIIILIIDLINELTIYPWMIYFYYNDGVWEGRSMIFCKIWSFIDWGLFLTHTILFAWATIERHILIFHEKWVSTRKRRFFVHYLPIIILLLYCIVYNIILDFFPPCENVLNDYANCLISCLYNTAALSTYDVIVHQMAPILTIVVFSIALLIRVIWQKRHIQQTIQWRKYRKMATQLLSISFLYPVLILPLTFSYNLLVYVVTSDVLYDFYLYTVFFSYFLLPLFPFVCTLSLPELRQKLVKVLCFRRPPRRVGIEVLNAGTKGNRQKTNP
ncbi:unnamed protein product [Adineta ricciae]|uniref:G-protein coupled receptors family 1 profile domain-containing protein n=1 Tax=Adineta ricciae TaxID=249248 RepID=A0A815WXG5_ADIRI|nr:unnamed protein product [Adineta ricciae]CAF1653511.1 unnamed protein product [Adineta ricciae]